MFVSGGTIYFLFVLQKTTGPQQHSSGESVCRPHIEVRDPQGRIRRPSLVSPAPCMFIQHGRLDCLLSPAGFKTNSVDDQDRQIRFPSTSHVGEGQKYRKGVRIRPSAGACAATGATRALTDLVLKRNLNRERRNQGGKPTHWKQTGGQVFTITSTRGSLIKM